MKKFLAVVVAALVIALALWVALRVQQANRQMQVSELLPKTTILLAEVPDLKRTRTEWRASDLYALWHEPALQAWLEKPLAELRQRRGNWSDAEHFLQLDPTNLFLALASLENNEPRFMVGFHFGKSEAEVRRFIESREAPWLAKSGSSKREIINYQEHQIETVNAGRFALATVFDRNWFFASNHLATLKTLLDRADRRTPGAASDALRESDVFQSATKQLPKDFAGMFFVDPRPSIEKLMPLLAMTGQTAATSRIQQFQKIRTVAGALGFDHGKMRETLFVAMPQQHPEEKLTRPGLSNAGKDTFLYSASLGSWPEAWAATTNDPVGQAMPAVIQNVLAAFARGGVSREDLGRAFGDEVELVGEWPENAHWPQVVLMLPVKDVARAQKAMGALDLSALLGSEWTRTEKEGVSFFSMNAIGGVVPIHPTIALSNRMLLAASDPAAAEAVILPQPAKAADSLQKTAAFQEAQARVGAAQTAFNYLDTRLIFERTDAALRPLLLMSATFYPALGKKVDVSKIPPADVIAKHLSPIVMSQRYTGGGYVTESIGPVTFTEATLGLGTAFAAGYVYYAHGFGGLVRPVAPAATPSPP
ncbi:MAG: hypothetical protein ACR2MW_11135 [Chthoniobacterales bacterium]